MNQYIPTPADRLILQAVGRYHRLTAEQVRRLLYGKALSHAQTNCKKLTAAGYLERQRYRPTHYGPPTYVYTLSTGGYRYLAGLGISAGTRYRGKITEMHLDHELAVVDVLIAAELHAQTLPNVTLSVVNGYQLNRQKVTVHLNGEAHAKVPDGWFAFQAQGHRPACFVLELDRGTEEQKYWKHKVRGLVAWLEQVYPRQFGAGNPPGIVVLVTESPQRAAQLRTWTEEQLTALGRIATGNLFLFGHADPATIAPATLFSAPLFAVPFEQDPVPLLAP